MQANKYLTSTFIFLFLLAANANAAVPSAPTLTISTSGLTVTASWNAVADATGYTLVYAPYPTVSYIKDAAMGTQTSFSATLTDGAAYYVAVKAYNSSGDSAYSNVEHFSIQYSSSTTSTVTDVESNVYNTIVIGTQTWMQTNLKVTKYKNGDSIDTTTSDISSATSPKYRWAYNADANNAATYGLLYTWYAATDTRGLCPSGWHLPTDTEWKTLTDYLGGESVSGGKMKELHTDHWARPNTGADNSSGFTGLPGGYRVSNGTYSLIGSYGFWWSATQTSEPNAWNRDMSYYDGNTYRYRYNKSYGLSVRCIKD